MAMLLSIMAVGVVGGDPIDVGEGTRRWLGPGVWPNPMQDWSVEDGAIVAIAGEDRTAHALGYWLTLEALEAPVEVTAVIDLSAGTLVAGFRLGIASALQEHRASLLAHGKGVDAAIDAQGRVLLGGQAMATDLKPQEGPVVLTLRLSAKALGRTALRLTATDRHGGYATIEKAVESTAVIGNIALLAESDFKGPTRVASAAQRARVRFSDWSIDGERVIRDPSAVLGPILWSQYTLNDGLLTLSAQMPPLGEEDARTLGFEVLDAKVDVGWREVARSAFDADARVAVFRVSDWHHDQAILGRLTYVWQGETHTWPVTIRPELGKDTPVRIAVMSCDAGYAFPQTPLVEQVLAQDPDLVFFAGDQIYEHFGGFGVARIEPVEFAILDYLRKYIQFGWTWREVLRGRPSVIIPDDHDVFHGNIWGAGGRLLESGERPVRGGYMMPVRFVNAVQRTQTASLPPPYDPTPTPTGIGVYYTSMRLGPVDLAIIEDRKWKDGPGVINGPIYERLSLGNAQLLGERQETFLAEWLESDAPFKVVLSQTMFAKPATHQGWKLEPKARDPDANGWPMPARDRALRLLGPDVVMVSGDQHLGMLARLGIDTWDDGPLAFMAPGTSNGHPRAWWPELTVDGEPASPLGYTGRFIDGLGNNLRVLAVANPEPSSNTLRSHNTSPYTLARLRGSGYGIAKFDPLLDEIDFALLRFPENGTTPATSDPEPFVGFPIKISSVAQGLGKSR
ncbi:MAG: alkaline phosphatase D family protein [Planctomycetota bacterium]